jgi:hypothetical protein
MIRVGSADEDEMVLAFLRMEYASDRFRGQIAEALRGRNAGAALIAGGDPLSPAENTLRRAVLGDFRGYGRDRGLFERFPLGVRWEWAVLEASDLGKIRYVDSDDWNELSGHTGSPMRAAEAIRAGRTSCGVPNDGFWEALAHLRRGETFPPLIALTDGRGAQLYLLEGRKRATAYALMPELFRDVRALIGFCDAGALRHWRGASADNPWNQIDLAQYERHMGLDSVGQLQAIGRMTKGQLTAFPARTVAILGVAGGNGLEHVAAGQFSTVYGIDVNPAYLVECGRRFSRLSDILRLVEADVSDPAAALPQAELVIANLLIEYVGCDAFARAVKRMGAQYVSCGIQQDAGDGFVSDSPYMHIFDGLSEIHAPVDAQTLCDCMGRAGYGLTLRAPEELPNQKTLLRLDFCRMGEN